MPLLKIPQLLREKLMSVMDKIFVYNTIWTSWKQNFMIKLFIKSDWLNQVPSHRFISSEFQDIFFLRFTHLFSEYRDSVRGD